ncbi:MAG: IS1634 family transposase, partial [Pirellulales bacterium]
RGSVVSKAPRSEAAQQKDHTRRTADGLPVQSFQCLLRDLATLCKHRVCWSSHPTAQFDRLTDPTDLQRRAFHLLGLTPGT